MMGSDVTVVSEPGKGSAPPKRRSVSESAWVNSANSFACCSAVMPMPVSETASLIQLSPMPPIGTEFVALQRTPLSANRDHNAVQQFAPISVAILRLN
jgi:hypothetical protein